MKEPSLEDERTYFSAERGSAPIRRRRARLTDRAVRRPERSDKVIWETVRKVAERVGVKATPHALRAAFGVQFDDPNPDQLVALKELMGHARMETTLVYASEG